MTNSTITDEDNVLRPPLISATRDTALATIDELRKNVKGIEEHMDELDLVESFVLAHGEPDATYVCRNCNRLNKLAKTPASVGHACRAQELQALLTRKNELNTLRLSWRSRKKKAGPSLFTNVPAEARKEIAAKKATDALTVIESGQDAGEMYFKTEFLQSIHEIQTVEAEFHTFSYRCQGCGLRNIVGNDMPLMPREPGLPTGPG